MALAVNNNASRLRREVLGQVAKLIYENRLIKDIDRLPYYIAPTQTHEVMRCCIHCDRAVIHARIIAALGFSLEDARNHEDRLLSEYATIAIERNEKTGRFLTMLEDACNSCLSAEYRVTNACQGCVARPCTTSCPKRAISISRQRAHIDNDACIRCGKCVMVCPYNAIMKMQVPCEMACPVDALCKDENGKEVINFDKCIGCGKCITACPFGAIMERSQIVDVMTRLKQGKKMVAFFAPAIVTQFPNMTPGKLISAIGKLGFEKVYEVALGADITSQKESAEFVERVIEGGEKLMTTSCCPAYYEAVQKHIPELKHAVSHTLSPMLYTAQMIQERHPDAIRVFIGPCLAKRREGYQSGIVNYVLSMEELGAIMMAYNIQITQCEDMLIEEIPSMEGRGYPVAGGVAHAVKKLLPPDCDCRVGSINGLTHESIQKLRDYGCGKCNENLLEVMACEGGCIAGPSVIANPKIAAFQLKKVLEETPRKE